MGVRSGVNVVVFWINEAFGSQNDLQRIRTWLLYHELYNSPMRYTLRHSAREICLDRVHGVHCKHVPTYFQWYIYHILVSDMHCYEYFYEQVTQF